MGAKYKSLLLLPAFAALLGACQTTYEVGTAQYGPANVTAGALTDNSEAGYVPAVDFLGEELMQGDLHTVDEKAWNDGYANTYKISTEDNVFFVQGTDNAKMRIHEIAATEYLSKRSVPEAIGRSLVVRGDNLIQTPLRAVSIGREKSSEVANMGDAFTVLRSGIGGVAVNLAGGVRELGVTGLRITRGVGGTRCSGVGQCVGKAGKDVWSGLNSIVGKHEASRRIHASVGTDPYTDNEVLQREVNRIAYADAYTGLSFKLGVGRAGIPFLSPYTTGVGYYNNVEFVAQYEDAEKRRDVEKARLLNEWGVDQADIDQLYKNPSFTHTSRTRLLQALEGISSPEARRGALVDSSKSSTRYVAESKVKIYHYLSLLDLAGDLDGYVEGSGGGIALKTDGTLVLPFTGDFISWTDDINTLVTNYAVLPQTGQAYKSAELHVLGMASPLFKEKAEEIGVQVIEIN